MTKRLRVVGLIASLALLVSVLAGTGAYVIINHINNTNEPNALSGTYTSIGNMLISGDMVNRDTYKELLTKLGNDTSSTRNKSAINGGSPVVFQMGEVNNKPIYWQVVYQVGDIITVWMTDCYTNEYYNYNGNAVKNSALAGYANGPYSNYSNYSKSVIRDVTKGIYNSLSTNSPVISKIVKSPSEAEATWQQSEKEDIYVYRNSSSSSGNNYIDSYYYYAHHNNLYYSSTSSYGGKYTGWAHSEWNSSDQPYSDKFWIPSYYEVFNKTNHSTSGSGWIAGQDSLWGLSDTDRGFATTTLDGSSVSYCWLRSGYSSSSSRAMLVISSGSANSSGVNYSYGVRPAAHISLQSLASNAGYSISASLASAATDRAQISQDASFYKLNSSEEFNLTYSAYTGYYISSVTVNSLNLTIAASVASAAAFVNFNDLFKYKCYRNGNDVIIILKEVIADLSFVGNDIPSPITVVLTGTGATTATKTIEYEATSGDATVSITPPAGVYVTGASLVGSSTFQDIDKWNDIIYQTSECLAVSYLNNNYSNRIKFYITEITGQVTLTLRLNNQQIPLTQGGGTTISGVALQTKLAGTSGNLECIGNAAITGYSSTDGLESIIVFARSSLGYAFSHWEVDGTTLKDSTGTAYGISASIPYDEVDGKILVAVFTKNSSNINTDTDNTDDIL